MNNQLPDSDDIARLLSSLGPLQYLTRWPGTRPRSSQWPLLADFDAARSGASDLPDVPPRNEPAQRISPVHISRGLVSVPPPTGATVGAGPSALMLPHRTKDATVAGAQERIRFPELHPFAPVPLVIAVVGLKGGAGRTTLAANIAIGLSQGGHPVTAIDLDPQDGLRHHFGIDAADLSGLSRATLTGTSWATALRKVRGAGSVVSDISGPAILPYGQIDELDQEAVDAAADTEPRWFERHLDSLALGDGSIVVVDLPARSMRATRHVLARANLVLCVSTADAAAYMCAPQMERLIRRYCRPRSDYLGHRYVLNQVDHASRLTHDVCSLFERDFGDRLVATVHRDQSVPEALTHHKCVFDYMPQSQAAHDMRVCVNNIAALLATCRAPLRVVSRAAMYA